MSVAGDFLRVTVDPGLAWCATVPGWRASADDRARVELVAISGQEAGWTARVQGGDGPAHGLWQFERGGAVRGVLNHPASEAMAAAACRAAGVGATENAVYAAIMRDDRLALAFARLLLWTDPHPLPAIGAMWPAWDYYKRNWRPGKPGPDRWPGNYQAAISAVSQATV